MALHRSTETMKRTLLKRTQAAVNEEYVAPASEPYSDIS
jgi:hypothetical protein